MIRLSRYLLRKLFRLLVWTILLAGLLVGALQLLLPYSDTYRREVAALVGGELGQEVQIGRIDAGWRGLGPELALHDLRLGAGGNGASSLHLGTLEVDFSLLDSLRNWHPAVRRVAVRGASLRITRQLDGTFVTSNLPPSPDTPEEGQSGAGLALAALPVHLELLESDVVWHDRMRRREPVRLTDLNVTMRNAGPRHQARGSFRLEGGRLELAAELERQDDTATGWSADFYLKGENLPFKRANDWLPDGYRLNGRYHAIEAWSHWERGAPVDLMGSLELQELELATPETGGVPLHAKRLAANFRWLAEEEGGQLDLADLTLGSERLGDLSVRLSRSGETLHVEAGVDDQRIERLVAALEATVDLPAWHEALAGVAPRGGLSGLRLAADSGPEGLSWSLIGQLHELHSEPWGEIPGISNLTGAFRVGPEGGALELASKDVKVNFRTLFRDPLDLSAAKGRVEWGRGDQGNWVLDAQDLLAENADIHTHTRLRMEFPTDPEASPYLDLQTDFEDGDASTTHKYLPTGIMSPNVVGWLDRAIQSGRVISGACIVRGTLRDFPYQGNDLGRFEVLFDVEKMKLDYWPGWPPIEELAARVRFWNDRFDVWVADGRIFDSRLTATHGWIDRLSVTTPFELDGGAEGPLADQLRLLRESPLAEDFAALTEGVKGKGSADLKLEFAIPVEEGQFRLDGRLKMRGATLQKEGYGDALTAINGEIRFDQNGVKAKGIKGQLRKTPLSLDLEPLAGHPGTTLAIATTRIDPARWQEKLPEALRPRITGTTGLEVRLELPPPSAGPDEPIKLRVASDLQGLAIDLPAPVGKGAETARPLRVETLLGGKGELPVEIAWSDLLAASLRLDRPAKGAPKPLRGGLRIGSATPPPPPEKGLYLTGKLEKLRLDPWLKLGESAAANGAAGDAKGGAPLAMPDRIDLQVAQLEVGDETLKGFHLDLAPATQGFAGQVDSDRVKGSFFLPGPGESGPAVVRLTELHLKIDPAALDEAPSSGSARDPRGLRGLDLQSEKLLVNDHDFGRFELLALPVERGLEIRTLELSNPQDSIAGSGEWLSDGGEKVHTRLALKLKSATFGDFLTGLGYAPQLKGGATEMVADLRWPGDPAGFSREALEGTLGMEIGNGTLEEMEPGFGRVFGLLNIAALQRRLRLDFQDLFGKGFSFDRISGNFKLEKGSAHTSDFRLESPAARVELQGRIGLAERDFDQIATVTGHLSSALPIAGAVVGGPAVGAALFLAQRLAGDRMDALSSIRYRVTGPWEEPEVNRITTESSEGDNAPDLEGMER